MNPKTFVAAILIAALPAPALLAGSSDDVVELKRELERVRSEYERRMNELESALAAVQKRQESTSSPPAAAPVSPPPATAAGARSRASFNPDISVIGDFLVVSTDEPGVERDLDFSYSEIEIGFQGVVDPYVRFDLFAAFHEHADEPAIGLPASGDPHGHEDDDDDEGGHGEEGGLEFELEEAYLTTLGLPAGLQLKAGRFRQAMGRQNLVHLPEDPWADQPTVNRAVFGEDQLIDDGFQLSWLLPTPFFWELSGTITRGPSESPTFARSEDDDFLHVVHSKWFFDVSDTVSAQLGGSWATGPGDEEGQRSSRVRGLDFTLKWIPSSYRGITWQSEVFWRDRPIAFGIDDEHDDEHDDEQEDEQEDEHELVSVELSDWGFYTWLEGRLSKRWYLGLRIDHFDYDGAFFEDGVDDRWDASLVATFRPTEQQALRLQAKRTWDDLASDDTFTLYFNWVWALGAHGAHPF